MSDSDLREKIYLFKCEQSGEFKQIQAIDFIEACKQLYAEIKSFSFLLIGIF